MRKGLFCSGRCELLFPQANTSAHVSFHKIGLTSGGQEIVKRASRRCEPQKETSLPAVTSSSASQEAHPTAAPTAAAPSRSAPSPRHDPPALPGPTSGPGDPPSPGTAPPHGLGADPPPHAADRNQPRNAFLPCPLTGRRRTPTDSVATEPVASLRPSPRRDSFLSAGGTLSDSARAARGTGWAKPRCSESVRCWLCQRKIVGVQAEWWILGPGLGDELPKARREGRVAQAHPDPGIAVFCPEEAGFRGSPRWPAGWGEEGLHPRGAVGAEVPRGVGAVCR